MSFKLPFGVEVLNPTPTDTRRGPYAASTEAGAKTLACTGVPSGVRGQGQQVDLIIAGAASVYVWANGLADTDLVPLEAAITSGAVTGALGFTPYDAANPSGYLTSAGAVTQFNGRSGNVVLDSADVTTALGFTPVNSFRGHYVSLAALQTAIPTGNAGDYALISASPHDSEYFWDTDNTSWAQRGTSIGAPGFSIITGNATDNASLNTALSGKQNTLANSDGLSEGSSNLYFTVGRVLASLLTGIGFSTATAVVATDSILSAIGKLQG